LQIVFGGDQLFGVGVVELGFGFAFGEEEAGVEQRAECSGVGSGEYPH